MTELEAIKRKLPCEYLRYYGKPKEKLTLREMCETGYQKQFADDKQINAALKKYELPELSGEKELLDFLYLRACFLLKEQPMGDFEGNAKICAETMAQGGDLAAMYRAGTSAVYASCLSTHNFDVDIQRKIIEAHIPF
jgi:hypothetical protein